MNLNNRLNKISTRPVPADAMPLSDLEPMSKADIRARGDASLRRHMKNQGRTDSEVDAYLTQSSAPHAMAA